MFILILHISIILYYYTIFDNFLSNAFYINFLIIKIFIKRIYFLSHTYVYNFTSQVRQHDVPPGKHALISVKQPRGQLVAIRARPAATQAES